MQIPGLPYFFNHAVSFVKSNKLATAVTISLVALTYMYQEEGEEFKTPLDKKAVVALIKEQTSSQIEKEREKFTTLIENSGIKRDRQQYWIALKKLQRQVVVIANEGLRMEKAVENGYTPSQLDLESLRRNQ